MVFRKRTKNSLVEQLEKLVVGQYIMLSDLARRAELSWVTCKKILESDELPFNYEILTWGKTGAIKVFHFKGKKELVENGGN